MTSRPDSTAILRADAYLSSPMPRCLKKKGVPRSGTPIAKKGGIAVGCRETTLIGLDLRVLDTLPVRRATPDRIVLGAPQANAHLPLGAHRSALRACSDSRKMNVGRSPLSLKSCRQAARSRWHAIREFPPAG